MTTTKIPVEFLNALSGSEITDGSIGTADIADDAITTAKIAANAITATELPDNVITATHIPNGLITGTHMAGTTITATQIANNAVGTDQLAGIARGKIIYGDSNGDPQLLALGSNGQVLKSDGSDIAWSSDVGETNRLPLAGGTMTGNIAHAGNFTIDAGGEIVLDADGGNVVFKDGGTSYVQIQNGSGSQSVFQGMASNQDMIFKVNDGGSYVNALTFDASEAGAATFNSTINDLTLSAGEIATDAANNFRLNTPNSMRINIDSDGNSSGEVFQIGHDQTAINDTNVLFRVQENGNVGIGTTSPSAALDVVTNDNVWVGEFTQSNTSNGDGVIVQVGSTASADYALSIRADAGNTHVLAAKADGKVGIGTATPSNPLSVSGVITSGNFTSVGVGGTPGDANTAELGPGYLNLARDDTADAKQILFGKNGAVHSYLETTSSGLNIGGGNVGIGTTAPTSTLDLAANGSMGLGLWKSPDGALRTAQKVMYVGTGSSGSNSGSSGGNEHGIIQMFHDGDEDIRLYTQGNSWITGGNVGIGTTSPSSLLHVDGSFSGTAVTIHNTAGSASTDRGLDVETSTTGSTVQRWLNSGSELARITGSGNLIVGDTSYPDGNNSCFGASTGGTISISRAATNAQNAALFYNPNGGIGSIRMNGSATAFNTSSDYRLKENVVTDWDGTTLLKQLKPSKFNFKADTDTTVQGFLAHEVSSIVPLAVSGEKDAVYTAEEAADDSFAVEGQPNYQQIDHSKLVPLLVKTVQELEARIKVLEG